MSEPRGSAAEQIQAAVNVRRHRERAGMTTEQLANAVGISRPYLSNIEAGRKRLTPYLAIRIAEALGVSEYRITGRRAA
jgi:transcriptional regulator with XRE-family HTH domain